MKRFILFVAMLVIAISATQAQTFKAPSKAKTAVDSTTTFKYEMKDSTYTVYKSKGGAFYVWKVSKKTGNKYRMYLPKEVQEQMGRKYPAEEPKKSK